MARLETDCKLKTLGKRFQIVSVCLQKIDIHSRSLIFIHKLKLYLLLGVQR